MTMMRKHDQMKSMQMQADCNHLGQFQEEILWLAAFQKNPPGQVTGGRKTSNVARGESRSLRAAVVSHMLAARHLARRNSAIYPQRYFSL